eukprot:NODE_6871_length_527_cov_155.303347_g6441_i0.p2 GENE.NODE_6871_length_527_cov_155.303347_g6441_i0~~NODE_6871_length_527_cov_155.303347_g6441_i0.p2  ORF type:complete len:122 (-),score=39.74 NODE_6871_length_527_cov_155.303347_g6441_i0:160-474(-)
MAPKQKKEKDPTMPKRPLSAYFIFAGDIRAQLMKENPAAKVTEIAGMISAKWKEIDSAEKEKYTERAAEAKEEYAKAMEEWKKSNSGHDDAEAAEAPKKKKKKE